MSDIILRSYFQYHELVEREIYLLAAELKANILRDDSNERIEMSITCQNTDESKRLEQEIQEYDLPFLWCDLKIPT